MKNLFLPLYVFCKKSFSFTFLFIAAYFFFQTISIAQPTLMWAKGMGSSVQDIGYASAVDASGNVYTTGYFNGTADFDPGSGVYNLTTTGGSGDDIFISKLDAAGNFVWAKQLGVYYNSDLGYVIKVDAGGNVYLAGALSNPLHTPNGQDILICKLDAAGNFLWQKQIGGAGTDYAKSLTTDVSGNVYISGVYSETVDFNPGASVNNLSSTGYYDIFILKLDSSGNFIWAKSIGGNYDEYAGNIVADALGNLYVMGTFNVIADVDPGPATFNLTATGPSNLFIVKLDTSGNFIDAGSMNASAGNGPTALFTDAIGNIYISGSFSGTVDFNLGQGTYNLTAIGRYDAFITKLNAAGSFVWAKSIGGTPGVGNAGANAVAVDASGNVYTTGFFFDTADFDPGTGIHNLTAAGYGDIFILKLDSSGNFIWAKNLGGNSQNIFYGSADAGNSIQVNDIGNLYVSGYFEDTANFDFGTGTYNVTSNGSKDVFVLKLGQGTLPLRLLDFSAKTNNNQVDIQWQTASEGNTEKFIVERSSNQKIFMSIGTVSAAGISTSLKKYSFNDIEPLTGANYYRLKMFDKDGSFSYSKVELVKLFDNNSFNVYPNPAASYVQLQFNKQLNNNVEIDIVNAEGKMVLKTIEEGRDKIIINTSKLAAGNYVIKVMNGDEVSIRKLVVK